MRLPLPHGNYNSKFFHGFLSCHSDASFLSTGCGGICRDVVLMSNRSLVPRDDNTMLIFINTNILFTTTVLHTPVHAGAVEYHGYISIGINTYHPPSPSIFTSLTFTTSFIACSGSFLYTPLNNLRRGRQQPV